MHADVNYATQFPGATIETVPAAAFANRSFLSLLMAPLEIAGGIVVALFKLLRLRPAAVVGFGGYPSLPVMIAARLGGFPTAIHRAERRARPGQSPRGVRRRRGRRRLSRRALCAEGFKPHRLYGQSGARRGAASRRCALRAAGGERRHPAAGVRRQPGRTRPERVRSGCDCSAARRLARTARNRAAMPRRRYRVRALCLCRIGRQGGARDLLRRSARAHGGVASGDRAQRRLDHQRIDRHRPARDPRSLPLRDRTTIRRPMRTCSSARAPPGRSASAISRRKNLRAC